MFCNKGANMSIKNDLINQINNNPMKVREAFCDSGLIKVLKDIGIANIQVFELHAPALNARKKDGFGSVLCRSSNGTRHKNVTCKKCLKILKEAKK